MQTLLSNIKKLQRMQTSVARVVLPDLSHQPATALLSELHWLPVNCRITFKLTCHTYKSLTTGQRAYLCTLLHHYNPTHTLRSTNQFFLDVPRFSIEFGKRLFSYLAPTVWNGLPLNIRLSDLISDFRHLQTPSENSPFEIAHQHLYHAGHLVTASASHSVPILNLCAL